MPRIVRSQNPPLHGNYKKYKPYLRIDFLRRCAYCHMPEIRFGGSRNFAVEHFQPKKLFPTLRSDYSNLYYACNTCNDFKGAHWPTEEEWNQGRTFVDPCLTAMSDHIDIDATGTASPRTPAGRYTAAHLNLDREHLKLWRACKRKLEQRLADLEAEIAEIEADAGLLGLPRATPLLASLKQFSVHLRNDLVTEYANWWESGYTPNTARK